MATGSLMKVDSIAECSTRIFCNTFDLHKGLIGLEKHFLVFLREAVLDRFYCKSNSSQRKELTSTGASVVNI